MSEAVNEGMFSTLGFLVVYRIVIKFLIQVPSLKFVWSI